MEPVALSQVLREGSRVQETLRGELVPELRDRARQRAGGGRSLLAVRERGGPEGAGPVVLPNHGLRRGAVVLRRPASRRAGAPVDHAAQLDLQEYRRGGGLPARLAMARL